MSEIGEFSPPCPLHTPVLFLVYKRADTTRQVFEAIRQAKPPRLYVAADGPKADVPGEAEKVREVRDIVLNGVDWDCEVKTLFRDKNLGCKRGVSEAINWFFEHEEQGIILEDDCLPHPDFFHFCECLLNKYNDDQRVMHIGGSNLDQNYWASSASYRFAKHMFCWGWATWARAWKEYDSDANFLTCEQTRECLRTVFPKTVDLESMLRTIWSTRNEKSDTWDYQWGLSIWLQYGLCIIPRFNMITNIGNGPDSTHSTKCSKGIGLTAHGCDFPLVHPAFRTPDANADKKIQAAFFRPSRLVLFKRLCRKVLFNS